MSDEKTLDSDERTLVDSNFFVAIGNPDNEKFQRFHEIVTENEVVGSGESL